MESGMNWVERTAKARNLAENEYLEGELIGFETQNQTHVIVLKTQQGEIEKIWQSTQLESQLTEKDISKIVALKYLGDVKAASGRLFRNHQVWVAEPKKPEGGEKGD